MQSFRGGEAAAFLQARISHNSVEKTEYAQPARKGDQIVVLIGSLFPHSALAKVYGSGERRVGHHA